MLRYIAQWLCSFQPYLPQIYVESDMDATNCYLFFQRLAAKVDLINTVVAQMHNLPEALNGPVSDVLVGICEVRPCCFMCWNVARITTAGNRCEAVFPACRPHVSGSRRSCASVMSRPS